MLLNPNPQQTDSNQPNPPNQVDPDEIPQEKKEADMRALLQAIAVKRGKSVSELKPDLPGKTPQRDSASQATTSMPNPFRGKTS